ncbi:predicted GPI-anchored protein 58 [Diachasma alloeum]|uniref:predicted GPI-anchored protein 58 n=1 Tax=Diachasma alloeum TaxID=454923 RepID=UPI0007382033|nr:predicted GPI-anchored protein 58 [Diachasma alloeum]
MKFTERFERNVENETIESILSAESDDSDNESSVDGELVVGLIDLSGTSSSEVNSETGDTTTWDSVFNEILVPQSSGSGGGTAASDTSESPMEPDSTIDMEEVHDPMVIPEDPQNTAEVAITIPESPESLESVEGGLDVPPEVAEQDDSAVPMIHDPIEESPIMSGVSDSPESPEPAERGPTLPIIPDSPESPEPAEKGPAVPTIPDSSESPEPAEKGSLDISNPPEVDTLEHNSPIIPESSESVEKDSPVIPEILENSESGETSETLAPGVEPVVIPEDRGTAQPGSAKQFDTKCTTGSDDDSDDDDELVKIFVPKEWGEELSEKALKKKLRGVINRHFKVGGTFLTIGDV